MWKTFAAQRPFTSNAQIPLNSRSDDCHVKFNVVVCPQYGIKQAAALYRGSARVWRRRGDAARSGNRAGGDAQVFAPGVGQGRLMRKFWSIFTALLLLWATDSLAQESSRRVSYLPHWLPQSQFAGYYVACEKGFYRKHGIDIEILRGGPDRSAMEYLRRGRADFASSFLSCAIRERVRGLRLINIAQIIQRSTQMLIAKKSGGIKLPKDMNGRRVGLWGADFQVLPKAFFMKYDLNVKEIEQGPTMNLFLRGAVDVASAMWYNEYHTVLNSGVNEDELTTFFFSDHCVNLPEDGLYALEDTCKKDPEKCRRFVTASLEGWAYAFRRPEEALDIVMKYVDEANVATNRCHQKWMLERMKDVILPPGLDVPVGVLREEDYANVVKVLETGGLEGEVPAYSSFFLNCVEQ